MNVTAIDTLADRREYLKDQIEQETINRDELRRRADECDVRIAVSTNLILALSDAIGILESIETIKEWDLTATESSASESGGG